MDELCINYQFKWGIPGPENSSVWSCISERASHSLELPLRWCSSLQLPTPGGIRSVEGGLLAALRESCGGFSFFTHGFSGIVFSSFQWWRHARNFALCVRLRPSVRWIRALFFYDDTSMKTRDTLTNPRWDSKLVLFAKQCQADSWSIKILDTSGNFFRHSSRDSQRENPLIP